MRIGFSRDIHRLVSDRELILGGVNIPYSKGLLGHSDADVIYHVVAEAIYGALNKGDLGTNFSDKDAKNKDLDSALIVKDAVTKMKNVNFEVANIDILVVLEEPKLSPYLPKMQENIAKLIETSISNVSIKASTNEGIDEVGNKNAIIAYAIVLLKSN
ncbi:MAG: 2-C-methyl-D-erythritol 2,4-cyclodiphosphate synthase [Bacilli bacterium]|jgi:2-C-methyl-D-erythritol 2,4-cyclodiphosphate synthase